MKSSVTGTKSVKQRVLDWYEGTYVPPPPNEPGSPIIFISAGHYEQPPLAKALKWLGNFWLKHWQWIIGTVIGVIGIVVSIK